MVHEISFFLQTVSRLDPKFIALHCQEVGGKNYECSMKHVEYFVRYVNFHPLFLYLSDEIYGDLLIWILTLRITLFPFWTDSKDLWVLLYVVIYSVNLVLVWIKKKKLGTEPCVWTNTFLNTESGFHSCTSCLIREQCKFLYVIFLQYRIHILKFFSSFLHYYFTVHCWCDIKKKNIWLHFCHDVYDGNLLS